MFQIIGLLCNSIDMNYAFRFSSTNKTDSLLSSLYIAGTLLGIGALFL